MYLPQQYATVALISGVWVATFDTDNVHRWIRTVWLTGGPPNSTVRFIVDGQFSPQDPIASGSLNSIQYDPGERLLPAGQQLAIQWNLGTGNAPQAGLLCELESYTH
jgi:hypothetical protein